MNRQEHLLTIIQEECAEVSHRVSKVARFGWGQRQTPQHPINNQRVMDEFHDLVATMEMAGFHPRSLDEATISRKKEKVEAHLQESRELGTLHE